MSRASVRWKDGEEEKNLKKVTASKIWAMALATISNFKLLLFLVVQVIYLLTNQIPIGCQILQEMEIFRENFVAQVFPAPICECPNLPSQMTCTNISPQTLLQPKPPNFPQFLPPGCSAACNITSLTVSDSDLSGFDQDWLCHLNLCPSSLITIMVGRLIWFSTSRKRTQSQRQQQTVCSFATQPNQSILHHSALWSSTETSSFSYKGNPRQGWYAPQLTRLFWWLPFCLKSVEGRKAIL